MKTWPILLACVALAAVDSRAPAIEPPDPRLSADVPAEIRRWFRNPDGSCVQCSIGMCGVDQNVPAAASLLWDTDYGPRVRGGSGRVPVQGRALERAQAEVHAATDLMHGRMAFDRRDGGQEARALQAVAVQLAWRQVRRRDERHAALEQVAEQVAEDHRIADVRDEQLVEAQHARVARDAVGDPLQRIARLAEPFQFAMDLAHEAMEVHAAFVRERQRREEQIHEPGLAAPDRAPQVQALHRRVARGATRRGA